MKRILLAATALLALSCARNDFYPELQSEFTDPPHESRPMVLWHWMNGNITKDGIRKDLQWMHDIGLSGFFLFDCGNAPHVIVKEQLPFMSEGWKDALRYAVHLADSLDLEVGIASSPGWSLTGGPWVSEDDAQKKVVWSSIPVQGHFRGELPLPEETMAVPHIHYATPEQHGIVGNYLKEICVMAVKQGAGDAGSAGAVEITSSYKDGILDWTAPEGEWTVYRFAYTLIGHVNGPATPEATGLEVDKLNPDAVRRYWDNYLGLYREALGRDFGPGSISNLDIDSYESGKGTWTLNMEEEFAARRGYALRPWLPALAGAAIGGAEERERFLFDWWQTLGEMLAEYHYDLATEILHANGIRRYSESHEERRSFIGDGMMVKRTADVPQAAFWARFRAGAYATMPHMEADIRESSSVAHIYGQNICAAESFTTNGRPGKWDGWWAYQCHPGKLKPVADAALAQGLNRFVLHTSVHQPSERHIPGLSLGPYGQWFNRHDTWAAEARPWTDYIARSCHMLSRGRFVADIAYLYGEDTNPTARFGAERPGIPAGWQYDFVNADALVNALEIRDGALGSKAGVRYRILVIDSRVGRMSDALAAKIEKVRKAGIPVLDLRTVGGPAGSAWNEIIPGDYACVKENAGHAAALKAKLEESGIAPDVSGLPDSSAFVHRKLAGGEIYWIANICSRPRTMTLGLRDFAPGKVLGKSNAGDFAFEPQLWRADRATVEDVSYRVEDGRFFVDLELERDDAVFLVLHGRASSNSLTVSKKAYEPVDLGAGAFTRWSVHFAPKADPEGGAKDYDFDGLSAWNGSRDEYIRYFSGTATYRTAFSLDGSLLPGSFLLDLGGVCNMAHVYLNGEDLGLLWKVPFTLDVSGALKPGDNQLEIKVTNSWGNRLIGDARFHGDSRATWTSWEFYSSGDPEPVSGLLGPVRLLKGE